LKLTLKTLRFVFIGSPRRERKTLSEFEVKT